MADAPNSDRRLFLLDGMALAYRAHFAFATRPIRTSSGFNTSALFGFINTLLDILQTGQPTHVALALDTPAPTPRHILFPAYKAQREAMPEDLSAALPHLRRILEAFRIPCLSVDGFEADDLIGTLVKRAEPEGLESFMVTPDKDFGQLVSDRSRIWKPGRQGGEVEILGPAEICARWSIARVDQVVDMLGLMGDAVDNIPGVPGVGEKTAAKLLAQFDTLEGVLAHADSVKGRLGESLRAHRDDAILSKKLATIITDVPVTAGFDALRMQPRDDAALSALCVEFELNAIGRRLFGDAFKAGRASNPSTAKPAASARESRPRPVDPAQADLFDTAPGTSRAGANPATSAEPAGTGPTPTPSDTAVASSPHKTIADVPHEYHLVTTDAGRRELAERLGAGPAFCFDTETDGLDAHTARLVGIAFSNAPGRGWYVAVDPKTARPRPAELEPFLDLLARSDTTKIGHNLKFDLKILHAHGIEVAGPYFDTMIAHALVEPELRHGMDYLAQALLDYTPIPIERLIGPKGEDQRTLADVPLGEVAEYAAEDADVTWQLYERLAPELKRHEQERVFHEVEMPVLPALVAMEWEGIRIDATALADFSAQLAREMAEAEADVHRLAGHEFNVHSPKQLGAVLFDELKLAEKPRKTATGQYATDEQTLQSLSGEHEIIRRLLEHRAATKLKSTYADALPEAIHAATGRVHTTLHQATTATGRLSSVDPNLQNIPIRTERGQEIRRAFVARDGWQLLSADYSQIELRIIAALSREDAMIDAFRQGKDIHRATAARVFGAALADVTPEQRRRAKMVNFGIVYGISAFGLAQRLGIPRAEAAAIIEHYFASYPGIRRYMDETIEFARAHGYVKTLTGRRRALRDVTSANGTVRAAAERNAINTPIQGTAADMIKIAMARIHSEIVARRLHTRLLLQVHDELLFDLAPGEESTLRPIVESCMRTALPLPGDVPIEVGIGTGHSWLAAH